MTPTFSTARLRGHRNGRLREIHDVAVRLGISDAEYENIESGRLLPGEEMISRIAHVLDVPVEQLHSAPGTPYVEDYADAVLRYATPMTEEDIDRAARAILRVGRPAVAE